MQLMNKWERVQEYGNELGRVCDQVNMQLIESRRRREAWFRWMAQWKEAWLYGGRNKDDNSQHHSSHRM